MLQFAPFDAAILDGTNLMLLSRGDAGFGVTHADAFVTWLKALLTLTSCNEFYVVFDNKRGSSSSTTTTSTPPHVPDVRRAAVPNYLDNRHARLQRKKQQQQQQQQQQQHGLRGGTVGGGAEKHPGGDSRAANTQQRPQQQQQQQQQQQPYVRQQYDPLALRQACEALMDRPPPHLFRFVQAVRQLGGLALYGLPGHEADDLIASLATGLLQPPTTPQADSAAQPTAATSARMSTSSTAAASTAASSAASTASLRCQVRRAVVVSADSDMLQLLGLRGCAWLELRPLSSASSPRVDSPLAVTSAPLRTRGPSTTGGSIGTGGSGIPPAPAPAPVLIPEALLRLHEAANAVVLDAADGAELADGDREGGQRQRQRQEGQEGLQGLLPPAAHADYLALVGKPEAGVPGVGVSNRTARKLLTRYGSVEGVVQAYEAGALDGALRPVAGGGGGGAGASAVEPALPGGGGGGTAVDSYPPAVRQALRNIRVTRMRVDLESVPWERVRDYQHRRRRHRPSAAVAAAAAAAAAGQQGVEAGAGAGAAGPSSSLAAHDFLLPHLHPHDQLHATSAAPFTAQLAGALRRRGLTCRTSVVDEQGLLVDIVVSYPAHAPPSSAADAAPGRAGAVSPTPPVGPADASSSPAAAAAAAAASQGAAAAASWPSAPPSEAAPAGAVEAAADAVAAALKAAQRPSPPAASAAGGCGEALRVCVLSPWDFKYDPTPPRPPPGPSASAARGPSASAAAARGSTAAAEPAEPAAAAGRGDGAVVLRAADGSGGGARGGGGGAGGGGGGGGGGERLLDFARVLGTAVGRRASLAHTPKALQAALRATTGWRLKRLQRSAAAAAPSGAVTAPAANAAGAVAAPAANEAGAVAAAADVEAEAGGNGGARAATASAAAGSVVAVAVVPFYELVEG
ncbi:hypothetical protein PLESTB_000574500 [Pleodorina starrii]|uniref:5'-3' exonuclease domain-containing protein n=1 Tax=Pleodorina starrii TaxID=330485 RepID=A0A9W6BHS3_9CHLO|nr:hypothetical protein PLESTM_000310300 [Pleodorina starrii]GLC52028.1 hypothetical protein PLESTB_000574500 [Pleodorina starrii]